ncbi:MAG: hypothetical protein NTU83_07885, partial [Candidatus Hydrogenedentes bacterium]|nr:hypothetical protein [Candidatus Hydrogenedentota bacterium]
MAASGGYVYFLYNNGQVIEAFIASALAPVSVSDSPSYSSNGSTYYPSALAVSRGFLYCLFNNGLKIGKYDLSSLSNVWLKDGPTYSSGRATALAVAEGYVYCLFNNGQQLGKFKESDLSQVWMKPSPFASNGYLVIYPVALAAANGSVYCLFTGQQRLGKYDAGTLQQTWLNEAPSLSQGATKLYPSAIAVADTSPPTGSIVVAGGAEYTTTRTVVLTLSASDGAGPVSSMRFGSDGSTWQAWEAYATTKNWTLPAGDGTKHVYVQFEDTEGNVSQSYNDTIIFDTTAPAGTMLINNGDTYAPSNDVTLTLSATDAGSGLGDMR